VRGISWKALVIAAIAFALAVAFVDALINAATSLAALAIYGGTTSQVFDTLRSMPAATLTDVALSFLSASLSAGYLAARTAGVKHLLNGMVATVGPILVSLYVANLLFGGSEIFAPSMKAVFAVAVFIAGPMLGAFGGYLAQLRQVQIDALIAEDTVTPDQATAEFWIR
jgi:hypothetical protein